MTKMIFADYLLIKVFFISSLNFIILVIFLFIIFISCSYNKSDDLKVNSLKLVYILFCSLLGKLFVRNPSIIPKINSRWASRILLIFSSFRKLRMKISILSKEEFNSLIKKSIFWAFKLFSTLISVFFYISSRKKET